MSRRATTAVGALLSATILASGSAAAHPAPDETGVATTSDVVLNEIGVALDRGSPDHGISGGFIELMNNGTANAQIGGFVVEACTGSDPTFRVEIPGTIELAPGEAYLLGDSNYASDPFNPVIPDQRFASGEVLEQVEGGAALLESLAATEPLDEVTWGINADVDCADPAANAGVLPDDDHSIQPNANPSPPTPWCRAIPTPGGANGPCVL